MERVAENNYVLELAAVAYPDPRVRRETGIDYLMVELHLFKNKPVTTLIDGIASVGSKRAMDLDARVWALQRDRGPRVLTGATATPIANSIVGAWIMQTYTQPDVLAECGLDNFDAWAATFGQTFAAVELAPDGGSSTSWPRTSGEEMAAVAGTPGVDPRARFRRATPAVAPGGT